MTLGSHQRAIGLSQTHLTPRSLLDRLGAFDLDPCAADPRPWDCAKHNLAFADDGLSKRWHGRVWLNPPFDRRVVGTWIGRLAAHGDGIALIHARVETDWFQPIWKDANAVLFLRKRISFCTPDGTPQPANSGAPVCLAAFGAYNAEVLSTCGLEGTLVTDWKRVAQKR